LPGPVGKVWTPEHEFNVPAGGDVLSAALIQNQRVISDDQLSGCSARRFSLAVHAVYMTHGLYVDAAFRTVIVVDRAAVETESPLVWSVLARLQPCIAGRI
jgi:hypothetical protein